MKRLRIVSYAINGRGVGHLVRQLSILRWIRRYGGLLGVPVECWVLTTSEADTLARREGFAAFKMPSKAMMRDAGIEPAKWISVARQWVLNAVAGISPDLLIVDTFPGGSFGELVSVLEMVPTRVLVARAVRDEIAGDDAYKALLPMYQRAIIPDERGTGPILLREREELLARSDARAALGIPDGKRAVYVTLGGGGDEAAPRTLPVLTDRLVARGWHVVVGAGPLYQGVEKRGANITWMDRYVPLELLAGVDAAVSAGGYNTVTELMFAGVPTVFLPQPRIADDQEGRAQAAADAGAGRIARSLDEIPDLLEDPGDPAAARALVPHNGARRAAAEILGAVLPAADIALAASVLSPALWARAQRIAGLTKTESALELVTAVLGETPTAVREKDALLAELLDERGLPPLGSGAEGRRGLIDERGLPPLGSGAEGRRGLIDERGLPPLGSGAEGRRGLIDERGLPPLGSGAEGRRGLIDERGLPPLGSGAEGRRGLIDERGLPPLGSGAEGRRGLIDDGVLVSAPARRKSPATERVEKFLGAVEASHPPIEHAIALVRGLRRKFPAAGIDGVVDACAQLFPVWARFADWMGAVSLVNALPAQRAVTIFDTARSLTAWLATEDDLFDALRRFARLEGNGAKPLADVLRTLESA